MNRLFTMLAAVSLSATALAGVNEPTKVQRAEQHPTPKEGGKAPMMVSFAELKWELPERKGMQFAGLSGDPNTGEYTQMRKVPAGTDNPLHAHSSEIKNVVHQRRLVHWRGSGVG